MVVCHCMVLVKDQIASLAFECVGITIAEHAVVGMDVVVKSVVDDVGDLYLQEDINHV